MSQAAVNMDPEDAKEGLKAPESSIIAPENSEIAEPLRAFKDYLMWLRGNVGDGEEGLEAKLLAWIPERSIMREADLLLGVSNPPAKKLIKESQKDEKISGIPKKRVTTQNFFDEFDPQVIEQIKTFFDELYPQVIEQIKIRPLDLVQVPIFDEWEYWMIKKIKARASDRMELDDQFVKEPPAQNRQNQGMGRFRAEV